MWQGLEMLDLLERASSERRVSWARNSRPRRRRRTTSWLYSRKFTKISCKGTQSLENRLWSSIILARSIALKWSIGWSKSQLLSSARRGLTSWQWRFSIHTLDWSKAIRCWKILMFIRSELALCTWRANTKTFTHCTQKLSQRRSHMGPSHRSKSLGGRKNS